MKFNKYYLISLVLLVIGGVMTFMLRNDFWPIPLMFSMWYSGYAWGVDRNS